MDTKFIEGFNITVEEERKELREFIKEMKKYEAIVKELSEILPKPHYIYKNCKGQKFSYYCNSNAIEILDNIKQKYFPKPVKKTVIKFKIKEND